MTAEEYQKCVEALTGAASGTDTTPTPSASTSSSSPSPSDDGDTTPKPSPSAKATDSGSGSSDGSSDSGSDDAAEPAPAPSVSKATSSGGTGGDSDKVTPTPTPTPSASASATEESGGGLLENIGDAITGIFNGGSDSSSDKASTTTSSAESKQAAEPTEGTAAPTPAASPTPTAADKPTADKGKPDTTTVKDSKPKVTEVLKDTSDTAAKATEKTAEAAKEPAASPSPSASATPDPDDCPAATDEKGDVDNATTLPDDPWTLKASSLTLNGADYKGIVKVRTADGTVKEVLKYVISGGTTIGDLHQIVKDRLSGKTYHAQAAKGTDVHDQGRQDDHVHGEHLRQPARRGPGDVQPEEPAAAEPPVDLLHERDGHPGRPVRRHADDPGPAPVHDLSAHHPVREPHRGLWPGRTALAGVGSQSCAGRRVAVEQNAAPFCVLYGAQPFEESQALSEECGTACSWGSSMSPSLCPGCASRVGASV